MITPTKELLNALTKYDFYSELENLNYFELTESIKDFAIDKDYQTRVYSHSIQLMGLPSRYVRIDITDMYGTVKFHVENCNLTENESFIEVGEWILETENNDV